MVLKWLYYKMLHREPSKICIFFTYTFLNITNQAGRMIVICFFKSTTGSEKLDTLRSEPREIGNF